MEKRTITWVPVQQMKPVTGTLVLVAFQVGNDDNVPEYAMAQYHEGLFYFNDYSDLKSVKMKNLLMPEQPTHWAFSIEPIN